jgi:hypothetical protein
MAFSGKAGRPERDPFGLRPVTPGPLGKNDAADPNAPAWLAGDTPGPLGIRDGADPNHSGPGPVLLAYIGEGLPVAAPPAEYAPDLGTNRATVQMYDHYFQGPAGALLKTRIEAAAKAVGLNPGLLAATLFAEYKWQSYAKQTGEVHGWDIGTDDYKKRKADIERRVPAARSITPLRYETQTNEAGRVIPDVPVFKAGDAVLASAAYLKYGELQARDAVAEMGGRLDRLPVEYRFALTRYGMNAGPGALRKQIMALLGMTRRHGKYVHTGTGRDFLQYKPWMLKDGKEQFTRHRPRRAATAHTAQAIHLSQAIFGVDPVSGDDSLLFVR